MNGCACKMEPSEISYKSDCLLIMDVAAGIGVHTRDGQSHSETYLHDMIVNATGAAESFAHSADCASLQPDNQNIII